MTPITAIVFDFDGVIADTEQLHLRAFQEVFAARGWTLDEPTYFDRYLGYDDRGLVAAYSRERRLGLDDVSMETVVEAKVQAFARSLSGDILYPGARNRLFELARRFPFGIASGALHAEITTILEGAGVLELFPVIVGADDVRTTKPSPEPYLTAAEKMGIDPSQCLAVEDSPTGLDAACAAGMRTVGVATSVPRAALSRAEYAITSLADLTAQVIGAVEARPAL